MKRLILILSILFISLMSYGQSFPRYEMINDTLVVCLTIEQAQKIDNDLDLLILYKQSSIKYDSVKYAYIKVINTMEEKIATLNLSIDNLNNINITNTKLINNLKDQITLYDKDLSLAKTQLDIKDQIIKNQKKEIRKQKTTKIIGFTTGVAVAISMLIILITH